MSVIFCLYIEGDFGYKIKCMVCIIFARNEHALMLMLFLPCTRILAVLSMERKSSKGTSEKDVFLFTYVGRLGIFL